MDPERAGRVGRILGVGTRIAVRKLREGAVRAGAAADRSVAAGHAAAAATAARAATPARAAVSGNSAGDAISRGLGRLARGLGRFFGALLRPFAHASRLLGLQIAGIFFALFAAFFLSHAWQTLRSAGWRDRHAEVYLGLGLVFAWFTVSSFWRARPKSKA